ncbi:hypothetical protein NIES4102_08020 [Chondrocystis sp. NIES-4102]|nr:hypothetical protein NIES4102_08020 [Chondrocystis sp. NIES-4102]
MAEINGTSPSTTITGNDTLLGTTGDDIITPGLGDDTVDGDSGNDTLVVDYSANTYAASDSGIFSSNDNLSESSGSFFAYSDASYKFNKVAFSDINNFQITGTPVADDITTGINSDTLNGAGGDDTLNGNAGDDTLNGGAGNDSMTGGAGNDTYIIDVASDLITETSTIDIDTVQSPITYTLPTNVEKLTLIGTTGINGTGNSSNNTLTGNSAANTLNGAGGDDSLIGGDGNDIYIVNAPGDVVTETNNVATQIDTVRSSADYTLPANVENITLTGIGNVNATGNELKNTIIGNTFNNTLDGGAGNDSMTGGLGNDTYVVDSTLDVVTETSTSVLEIDTVEASVNYTIGTNIENLTLTGSATNGTGNALANNLIGNGGNNKLSGLAGNDTMVGGAGDDTYVVDGSSDVITENINEGTDKVESSVTYTLGANIENLTLIGTTAIDGTGDNLNNTITGNAANNTLDGGGGNDTLTGLGGNDIYVVDSSSDVITEALGAGIDEVKSSVTYTLGANVENLTLTGTTAIDGTGNALNNTITGNIATNTLTGGLGNDIYVVDSTSDVVVENSAEGIDEVSSGVTYTLGANVENLTLTGTTAIDGTGNALGNKITGNTGNNILDGAAGNDTLNGGTGNDTYIVDTTLDTITEIASSGTDKVEAAITYTIGANIEDLTLTGSGDINGTGNILANTITGNAGKNILSGLAGNDTMAGAAGDDSYIVESTGDVVTEAANEGTDKVDSTATYALGDHVENLTLTGTTNITGSGNALNNLLLGNTGSNTLTGLGGDDTLNGGTGTAVDTLVGGVGNDLYQIDSTTDIITEAADEGIDKVESSVTYTLGANLDNLTLTGTTAINGTGNALNNTIVGNTANNTLTGLAGDDIYVVNNTTDIVTEAANEGTDKVDSSVTYTLGDNLENLTLTGTTAINGTGNDLGNNIIGNSANNIISGLAGNDTMAGRAGNDIYVVDNSGDSVTELNGEGTDEVKSSVTYTLGAFLEDLTLTGTTAINGTGNNASNKILGNTADNNLTGGLGNDTLNGGTGNDSMIGGIGGDTYIVDSTTDTITEAANEGTDTIESSVTYTISPNAEHLTLTGTGTINGIGNVGLNKIVGNTANNILNGGLGIDTLAGGAGNDTYVVDTITDTITELASQGTDQVNSSVSYDLGENLENLTLIGSATNGTGNTLGNSIIGNAADNTLAGGAGNDTLAGGAGNDTYVVDSPLDLVTEGVSLGTDEVSSSVSYTLGANVENLTLTGTANINGTGNTLGNSIIGNAGNNTLAGGAGNDTLTGGTGSDQFVYDTNAAFSSIALGKDILSDFTTGTDKIVLDKTTFTALTSVAGDGFEISGEFAVVTTDANAAISSALIVYNSSSGNLYYNQNRVTDGFGTGGDFAILANTPTLGAADFILQV